MSQPIVDFLRQNIVKKILFVVSIFIFLAVIFVILRIGFAYTIYSFVANWVTVRLGFDYYFAEFTAVILTTLLMMFLPSILWFTISGRNKEKATIATIAGIGLVCVLVYFFGQDVYFNRVTGESLRYFTDTPDGRVFSFTKGFDPKYGNEFIPYTKDIANGTLKSGPTPPGSAEFGVLNFSTETHTLLSFTNPTYGNCLLKFQMVKMSVTKKDRPVVNLKYSVCNMGGRFFDLNKLYIWYTPPNGKPSYNWVSYNISLKPGECDREEVTDDSPGEEPSLQRPLGKLNISLNDGKEIFNTIDLKSVDDAGQIQ